MGLFIDGLMESLQLMPKIGNLPEVAIDLADFLITLQRIDATDGSPHGLHSFLKGDPFRFMTMKHVIL